MERLRYGPERRSKEDGKGKRWTSVQSMAGDPRAMNSKMSNERKEVLPMLVQTEVQAGLGAQIG